MRSRRQPLVECSIARNTPHQNPIYRRLRARLSVVKGQLRWMCPHCNVGFLPDKLGAGCSAGCGAYVIITGRPPKTQEKKDR